MLEPKRIKYRKSHKPFISKNIFEQKSIGNNFGLCGLIALESGRITNRQLEAVRRVIMKHIKKEGKLWFNVFPDKSVTSKPAEVRMGKGKGAFDHWVCLIRKGGLILEVDSEILSMNQLQKILKLAGERLPLRTKIIGNKI